MVVVAAVAAPCCLHCVKMVIEEQYKYNLSNLKMCALTRTSVGCEGGGGCVV